MAFVWEQRKLGDITESYSGGTPTAGKKEYYDGNIPFIRSGEISSDKTELFISEEGLNRSSAKMVKIGDILYALYGATSGEVSISKLKGAINQAILAIQPHQNYDSQFLMQWLRKSKENIIGTYLQGGQGNLSGNIVKELIIDIPTYEEQKEIGAYLKKLDHLITLHQRKRMLRRCFFSIDWEQRKLGEVAKYRNGKAHENCIDDDGKYIVVNSKFVSTNGKVKKFSNMQNEPLFENEVAFVLSDVPNGRAIARTFLVEKSDKYTLNQRIAGITPLNETDPYYLHVLMNRHPYFLAFDDGVKQTNLSVSDVMKFESYYPKYEEQETIGRCFSQLDQLITLHQCKSNFCKKNEVNAWEQRKVSEIADRFDNLRVPVAANLRTPGTTPYYGANGIQDYVEGYTHDGEFVLVAEDGANDLKNYPVKCVNGRIWVNNHAHVLQARPQIASNQFLAYSMSQANIEALLVGGGRAKLNAEVMMALFSAYQGYKNKK